jgi:hypothetical protein
MGQAITESSSMCRNIYRRLRDSAPAGGTLESAALFADAVQTRLVSASYGAPSFSPMNVELFGRRPTRARKCRVDGDAANPSESRSAFSSRVRHFAQTIIQPESLACKGLLTEPVRPKLYDSKIRPQRNDLCHKSEQSWTWIVYH